MLSASVAGSRRDSVVDGCLATLRGLGSSVQADFVTQGKVHRSFDGELRLRLHPRAERMRFAVQITRSHLSYALTNGLIGAFESSQQNRLLFAPYVPARIGNHLVEHGLSYVDTAGNCHIQLDQGQRLVAHVEGKRLATAPRGSGRAPTYQLIFAILAKPEILNRPIRELATMAGIGKTAAALQLNRLGERGLIERAKEGFTIAKRRELLDRWLSAYADLVRPSWLIGRYRAHATDPEELETQIAKVLRTERWAFGGGAAGFRMTSFYRGPDTILHVEDMPADFLRSLRAIPAKDGELTVLRTRGSIAYEGTDVNLAHPLLVYTEMAASADPRMNEAAELLRERFLDFSS